MHTACLLTDDGGGGCPGVCVRGCVRGLCVHTPRPRGTHKHLDPEAPPDPEAHPLDPQADTTPPGADKYLRKHYLAPNFVCGR